MAKRVEKKSVPESYNQVASGKRKLELRIADFPLAAGDTIVLKEYDPKTNQPTGRQTELKCKRVERINPLQFYDADAIKRNGLYVIEYE